MNYNLIQYLYKREMIYIKKYILNPISMFIIGLILGIISKLLDIYTTNLGNIFFWNFSMDSIWCNNFYI